LLYWPDHRFRAAGESHVDVVPFGGDVVTATWILAWPLGGNTSNPLPPSGRGEAEGPF
jgi:hypothetical protein